MSHLTKSRLIACAAFLAAAIAPMAACAVTKIDEGVSTGLTRRGNLNRVDAAHTDDAIYYWIKLDENPGPKASTRCVVTGGKIGTTLVDETDKVDEGDGEGYLFCGVDGDEDEVEAGRYTFTIYLDKEKLGEKSLEVTKRSFWSTLTTRRKYKYMMGALSVAIIAFFWVRKKFFGDKTFDEAFKETFKKDEVAAEAAGGVVIGSKVSGAMPGQAAAARPATPAAPPPPTPDEQYKSFKAKIAADATFRIAKAEEVLPIAKAARAAGDAKTAVSAVRGFDKAFPGHALIPDVFVFTAKVLVDDFKNYDMARKILEHVVAKYPGHHLAQEARNVLKTMPQSA